MKRGVIIILFTVINISLYAQIKTSSKSTTLSEAKSAIGKGNLLWIDGWKNGNAATLANLFEDNGIQLTLSGNIIKGKRLIQEHLQKSMLSVDPGVRIKIKTLKIWLDGTTAYESGAYVYEYSVKGKPAKDVGHYVTVWKRQTSGSWKLTVDMAVPNN